MFALTLGHGQTGDVIGAARQAARRGDFVRAERIIADHRAAKGTTPDGLEALSWLGREALAADELERAETYAAQVHALATQALARRRLDDEPHLPIALGAAIEVRAQASAARGARSEAVLVLRRELDRYKSTSIAKRIQKNLLLLSLEGQTAPALDVSEFIGVKPPTMAALRGKVVLLFFWAHWCSDCKHQGPVLERLIARYGSKGLVIVAPTQRYGYVAGGVDATPKQETTYIRQVTQGNYAFLADYPVPLSQSNHDLYGVSTTPTLVLVDRAGTVRLYHPGLMAQRELEVEVQRLVD